MTKKRYKIVIEYEGSKIPREAIKAEVDWLQETIEESIDEQDFSEDVKVNVSWEKI